MYVGAGAGKLMPFVIAIRVEFKRNFFYWTRIRMQTIASLQNYLPPPRILGAIFITFFVVVGSQKASFNVF